MDILVLPDRAVLRLRGTDSHAFLQGLISNDIALLAPERPIYAGLLSPQGKLLFAMLVFSGPNDEILLDVAAAQVPALHKRLMMYRLRKAVDIERLPTLAVFATLGTVIEGKTLDPRTTALGSRWIGQASAAQDMVDAGDVAAWRAHRLQLGIAEADELGSDQLLWLETGADLLNGVSFTKGCYVGQENTARMHHRDRVRRRIVPLKLAGGIGDGSLRDAAGRVVGSLLGGHRDAPGEARLAHLRMEAVTAPIFLNDKPVTVLCPEWLQPAFAGAA